MDGVFGIKTVHIRNASLDPTLLEEAEVFLSCTEVGGSGERGIVVAFYAEIISIAMVGVISPPIVCVVVVIITADGTHADATVRGKRDVVRVAEEYLANSGLPMRRGAGACD